MAGRIRRCASGVRAPNHYRSVLFHAVFTLLLMPASALAGPLEEQLEALGHPNTRLCSVAVRRLGLEKVPSVQFESQSTQEGNRQEIRALTEIVGSAVLDSGHKYVAFLPLRRWKKCRSGLLGELFWYGPDSEWISVGKSPVSALRGLAKKPRPEWRDAPGEAYIRFALARVELGKGRTEAGVEQLTRAADILIAKGDPMNLQPAILPPLVRYYLGSGHDPSLGQNYLNAYAMVAPADRGPDDVGLPLVRSAPIYPRAAYAERLEGYVVLEYRVSANGRVEDAIVIEEFPKGVFGRAALIAASGFIYAPKVVNGQRVPVEGVRSRITFEIGK